MDTWAETEFGKHDRFGLGNAEFQLVVEYHRVAGDVLEAVGNMGHFNAHSGFIRVIITAWWGAKAEKTELGKASENVTTNDQRWGHGVGPIWRGGLIEVKGVERESRGLRKEPETPRVSGSEGQVEGPEGGQEKHKGHESQWERFVNRDNVEYYWEDATKMLKIFLDFIFLYFFHVCFSYVLNFTWSLFACSLGPRMGLVPPEDRNGKKAVAAESEGWTPRENLLLTTWQLLAEKTFCPYVDRRAQTYSIYLGLLLYFCPT